MTIKEFTDKWLFAFEDREQKKEFEKEMKKDIESILKEKQIVRYEMQCPTCATINVRSFDDKSTSFQLPEKPQPQQSQS
jgi:hypothetical protein